MQAFIIIFDFILLYIQTHLLVFHVYLYLIGETTYDFIIRRRLKNQVAPPPSPRSPRKDHPEVDKGKSRILKSQSDELGLREKSISFTLFDKRPSLESCPRREQSMIIKKDTSEGYMSTMKESKSAKLPQLKKINFETNRPPQKLPAMEMTASKKFSEIDPEIDFIGNDGGDNPDSLESC